MTDDMARLHLMITGRVQGVGYRWWFQNRAMELGLSGWVRNRTDGAVEAEIQGSAGQLSALIESARKGSPLANVIGIEQSPRETVAGEEGFGRKSTT